MKSVQGWLCAALALIAVSFAPTDAMAQCSAASCTVTVSMTPTTILKLNVGTSSTALGNPTAADFAAGGISVDGPLVSLRANTSYAVSISATSSNFIYTGSYPNPNKSASQLTWAPAPSATPASCAGVSSYPNNMSASATLFSSATGGPSRDGTGAYNPDPSRRICFRMLWSYAGSPPGTYGLTVNFTISTP